jgi:hypothetical protein
MLEQLIIGGKIYLPFEIPYDWKGSIFESGLIEGLPSYISDENKIKVGTLNRDILLEMLRDRGYLKYAELLDDYISDYGMKLHEFDKVAPGMDYNVISALMNLLKIKAPGAYTQEQFEKASAVCEAYSKIRPALEVIDEYETVLTHSMSNNLLSSLPITLVRETR